MNKKYLYIFLFIVFVTPVPITYSFLLYQKFEIRKHIKHKLMLNTNRDEFVLLKFSKAEANKYLKWEHKKEFEFNYNMYDVVHLKTTTDSVFYWCWPDSKETKLNNKLRLLLMQTLNNNRPKKEHQKRIINFLKIQFCINTYSWNNTNVLNNVLQYSYALNKFISLVISPPTPPPEF